MKKLPEHHEQIVATHAEFICRVVEAAQNQDMQQELHALLRDAEQNGWHRLVAGIRRILAGDRSNSVFQGLDEEDRVLAESILRGLQNPDSLPDPRIKPDPTMAAPGLAAMILAAGRGNVQALTLISNMAEQMSRVGGPMAKLASVIRPLINGERNAEILCRGADEKSEALILGILEALRQSELN